MGDRKLSGVDLNLLTVFRAVDEARHVTRAAKQLGLSQPALSHALKRLRAVFGDPMFVKTSRGMVLTPLAESIAPAVRGLLARIESEVFEQGPFRPAELTRRFRIRTTDFIEGLFAATLLASVRSEAPGVRFSVLPVGTSLPKDELESGGCDLAIAGFFTDTPPSFHQETWLEDAFSSAVRAGHPRLTSAALRRGVTLDAFCGESHLLVAPSGELSGAVDRALAKQKRRRTVVAGSSGFFAAGWITSRSDSVLTAPSKLINLLAAPLGLTGFSPPIKLPRIHIAAVWHGRSHDDPAHRWFRERLRMSL